MLEERYYSPSTSFAPHPLSVLYAESKSSDSSPDSSLTEELYDRTYANFIEEIDAVDNGISDRDGNPR